MTHRTASWASLAFTLLLTACGGAGASSATNTGASSGTPAAGPSPASPGASGLGFDAKSAIHGIGASDTMIVVSDAPDLCAALAQQDACGTSLGTRFLRLSVAGKPPGTFSGTAATALLVGPDQVVASAGGGRVELGAESPDGLLSGKFDLGAAGISGQLTTKRCAALDTLDVSASSSQSCSASMNVVSDRSEFDERCACGAKATSRQCTLGAGDAAWSCLCTAASGAHTTCQAPVAQPGVVTTPPNCCPGG